MDTDTETETDTGTDTDTPDDSGTVIGPNDGDIFVPDVARTALTGDAAGAVSELAELIRNETSMYCVSEIACTVTGDFDNGDIPSVSFRLGFTTNVNAGRVESVIFGDDAFQDILDFHVRYTPLDDTVTHVEFECLQTGLPTYEPPDLSPTPNREQEEPDP